VPRDFTSQYKTIDLLNANNLPRMKNDILFIHASRGKVVNEATLMELIDTKNITAIIDVWADEPLFNIPLADKSLFLSPHVAGHSLEGKVLGTKMVLEAFQKHYQNTISPDYSEINRILSEHTKATEEEFRDMMSLYQKIQNSRVFAEDHNFMLSLKNLDKAQAGEIFLDYRQKYPIRREIL
jgi:erythronate-4-phosphate dehydrogenase